MASAQPAHKEPYLQGENPVTRDPLEEKATQHRQHHDHASPGLTPTHQHEASSQQGVPTSRGYGVHGSGPVDETEARATRRGGETAQLQNENVNADQALATLGEGDVADAVQRKSGTQRAPGQGPAEEQDFASDLDRKKAEQAAAREGIKEARKAGINVDGGAGGRLQDDTIVDV